ncbi:hypothetical protein Mro03_58560 [Microbispora rosea subsp. rosea]|nr:hypothetical protein Mro03_58560 [Microbispora rosea subsp. rosea]
MSSVLAATGPQAPYGSVEGRLKRFSGDGGATSARQRERRPARSPRPRIAGAPRSQGRQFGCVALRGQAKSAGLAPAPSWEWPVSR